MIIEKPWKGESKVWRPIAMRKNQWVKFKKAACKSVKSKRVKNRFFKVLIKNMTWAVQFSSRHLPFMGWLTRIDIALTLWNLNFGFRFYVIWWISSWSISWNRWFNTKVKKIDFKKEICFERYYRLNFSGRVATLGKFCENKSCFAWVD